MSTVSGGCCGGTGGAGCGLSPGSGRVTTGGGRLPGPLQQVLGAARPALVPASPRVTIRYDHHLPSWPADDWHSVALAPELISSSATAMDKLALVTLLAPLRPQSVPAYTGPGTIISGLPPRHLPITETFERTRRIFPLQARQAPPALETTSKVADRPANAATTWQETQALIRKLLERGLQLDGDFERHWARS